MIIAVDFDGTIVRHNYPEIGEEIPFAIETLKMLASEGHQLVMWSVRRGELLDEAVEWCRARGLEFWTVNRDFPEEDIENNREFSRKLRVDIFIDDRNLGGLLDWGTIYTMIHEKKTFSDMLYEASLKSAGTLPNFQPHQPLKWWQRIADKVIR